MIQTDLSRARDAWIKAAETDLAEHRRRLDSDFLKVQTDAGKVDFHALRHTFATMLAAANVHPRTAMELLRHSKIELTMKIYTHTQNQQLTDAIAALPAFESPAAAARPKIG